MYTDKLVSIELRNRKGSVTAKLTTNKLGNRWQAFLSTNTVSVRGTGQTEQLAINDAKQKLLFRY